MQFILEPVPVEKEGDLPVLLEPLIAAFRQERYVHIQDLYVWNYPMTYENMATVVGDQQKIFISIKHNILTKI